MSSKQQHVYIDSEFAKKAFSCTCGTLFNSPQAKSNHNKNCSNIFYKLNVGEDGVKPTYICYYCGEIGKLDKRYHEHTGQDKYQYNTVISANSNFIKFSKKVENNPINYSLFFHFIYKWNTQNNFFLNFKSYFRFQNEKYVYDEKRIENLVQEGYYAFKIQQQQEKWWIEMKKQQKQNKSFQQMKRNIDGEISKVLQLKKQSQSQNFKQFYQQFQKTNEKVELNEIQKLFYYPSNINEIYDVFASIIFIKMKHPKKIYKTDLIYIKQLGFYDIISQLNVQLLFERFGKIHPKLWIYDEQKINFISQIPDQKYKELAQNLKNLKCKSCWNNNYLVYKKINVSLMEGIFDFTLQYTQTDEDKLQEIYNRFFPLTWETKILKLNQENLLKNFELQKVQINKEYENQKQILKLFQFYKKMRNRFYQFQSGIIGTYKKYYGSTKTLSLKQLQNLKLNSFKSKQNSRILTHGQFTQLLIFKKAMILLQSRYIKTLFNSTLKMNQHVQVIDSLALKQRFSNPLYGTCLYDKKQIIQDILISGYMTSDTSLIKMKMKSLLQKQIYNFINFQVKKSELYRHFLGLNFQCNYMNPKYQHDINDIKIYKYECDFQTFLQQMVDEGLINNISKMRKGFEIIYKKIRPPNENQLKLTNIRIKNKKTQYILKNIKECQLIKYWHKSTLLQLNSNYLIIIALAFCYQNIQMVDLRNYLMQNKLINGIYDFNNFFLEHIGCKLQNQQLQKLKYNDFKFIAEDHLKYQFHKLKQQKIQNKTFKLTHIQSWNLKHSLNSNITNQYVLKRMQQSKQINKLLQQHFKKCHVNLSQFVKKKIKQYRIQLYRFLKGLWLNNDGLMLAYYDQTKQFIDLRKQQKIIDYLNKRTFLLKKVNVNYKQNKNLKYLAELFAVNWLHEKIQQQSIINLQFKANLWKSFQNSNSIFKADMIKMKVQTIQYSQITQLLPKLKDFIIKQKNIFKMQEIQEGSNLFLSLNSCGICQKPLIYKHGQFGCFSRYCKHQKFIKYHQSQKIVKINFNYLNNKQNMKLKTCPKGIQKNNIQQVSSFAFPNNQFKHENRWIGQFSTKLNVNLQCIAKTDIKIIKDFYDRFQNLKLMISQRYKLIATAEIKKNTFLGFYAGDFRQANKLKDNDVIFNYLFVGRIQDSIIYISPTQYFNHLVFVKFNCSQANCVFKHVLYEENNIVYLGMALISTQLIKPNEQLSVQNDYVWGNQLDKKVKQILRIKK